MSQYEPANAATIASVLSRYADWVAKQPTDVRWDVARAMNKHLDQMLHDDAFGTEGQEDPRGDHRG